MKHDKLKTIIKHFTPTLLDVVKPASSDEIAKLEALAGPLPQSYREFLELMGNFCPFVSHQVFLYSPEDLLEIYDGFEHRIPEGFLLIGRDTTGSTFDLYIRHKDRVVLRSNKYYVPLTNEIVLYESYNFESYLLSIYVPQILVRSLPFRTASVLSGTEEEIQDFQNKVDEVCKDFNIIHSAVMPDFRFYAGYDFVVGLHKRQETKIIDLYIGTSYKEHLDMWSDFINNQEKMVKMAL